MKPKETKAERKVRQDYELSQFVRVLRAAGNRVDEEMKVPGCEYVVDVAVLTPEGRAFAVEVQGIGFSHLSRKGFLRDVDKAQKIAAAGWVYFPVTWAHIHKVEDGVPVSEALEALHRCGVRVTCKTD